MQLDWNNDEYESEEYQPIAPGDYLAILSDEEERDLSSGKGVGLKLTFTILEGPFKGRKISRLFCVRHENQDTEKWAREAINNLSRACNRVTFKNTVELFDIPFLIRIGTGKDGYAEVKNFFEKDSNPRKAPEKRSTKVEASAPSSAGSEKKPWM